MITVIRDIRHTLVLLPLSVISKTRAKLHLSPSPWRLRIPEDIIYEIIDHLTTLDSDQSYSYDAEVLKTLCALCRVNRTVGYYATLKLYCRIAIHGTRQARRLVRGGGVRPGVPVRSLHLTHGNLPSVGTVSVKAIDTMAALFRLVAPTLERLFFAADWYPWNVVDARGLQRDILMEAIADWVVMRDLAVWHNISLVRSMSESHAHPPKMCASLRRVAFLGVVRSLSEYNIALSGLLRRCWKVEILALILAPLRTAEIINAIVTALPCLHRLILIHPTHTTAANFEIAMDVKEEVATRHAKRVSICEIWKDEDLIPQEIRSGTLWNSPGSTWPVNPQRSPER